ncbi:hypothetical protein STIAU_4278 [Stigmatella aurantiaca DW4/3-1]|uniref:Uncharacterized protein n=1 Tax=Stigmatella aurantiaca (strain DW4/3-1) TaxID=378806 RepID=Q092N9_STIAD|nr:hypothetical protein STIAU_4278 [Stigmatella aurantiaca DW4/3-1]
MTGSIWPWPPGRMACTWARAICPPPRRAACGAPRPSSAPAARPWRNSRSPTARTTWGWGPSTPPPARWTREPPSARRRSSRSAVPSRAPWWALAASGRASRRPSSARGRVASRSSRPSSMRPTPPSPPGNCCARCARPWRNGDLPGVARHAAQAVRDALGPLGFDLHARGPALQPQRRRGGGAASREWVEDRLPGAAVGPHQRLEHREGLVVGMVAPLLGLGIIVVASHHRPDGGRLPRAQRGQRRAGEDERHLVDAQELLVGVLVRGALAPHVLAQQVRVAELPGHGGDGLLAQEVRPDDQPRLRGEPRDGPGHPSFGEDTVILHGLEADDGVAIDLLVGAGVPLIPALAPAGEQAIRRVRQQQVGARISERGQVTTRLSRICPVAARGLGRKFNAHPPRTLHPAAPGSRRAAGLRAGNGGDLPDRHPVMLPEDGKLVPVLGQHIQELIDERLPGPELNGHGPAARDGLLEHVEEVTPPHIVLRDPAHDWFASSG